MRRFVRSMLPGTALCRRSPTASSAQNSATRRWRPGRDLKRSTEVLQLSKGNGGASLPCPVAKPVDVGEADAPGMVGAAVEHRATIWPSLGACAHPHPCPGPGNRDFGAHFMQDIQNAGRSACNITGSPVAVYHDPSVKTGACQATRIHA